MIKNFFAAVGLIVTLSLLYVGIGLIDAIYFRWF